MLHIEIQNFTNVIFFPSSLGFWKVQAVNEAVQKVKIQVINKEAALVVQGLAVISNEELHKYTQIVVPLEVSKSEYRVH